MTQPNGGSYRPSTALGTVDGDPTAAASDHVSSGEGRGCHKSSSWNDDDDDDEDCLMLVDNDLQSSGDGFQGQGHGRGREGPTGGRQPQTKTFRMENVVFVPGRAAAVGSMDDGHVIDENQSPLDHGRPEIVDRKYASTAASTPDFVWTPPAFRTRSPTSAPTTTSPGRVPAGRPADVWTVPPSQRAAATLPPSSKVTQHSSAHQQQQPARGQHQQRPYSMSLELNIGLIIGIGAGVVILTVIVGYAVYRYRAGCMRGGHHGSYRLDDASASCIGSHHHSSTGDPIDVGKMSSVGAGSRLLLSSGGGSGGQCGVPSDGVGGAMNGSASVGIAPGGGLLQLTRSNSKSNCKVPTKEWYV